MINNVCRDFDEKITSVRKCSRCSKSYEAYNFVENSKEISGVIFANIDGLGRYYDHDLLDLCPECSEQLMGWFNAKGKFRKE